MPWSRLRVGRQSDGHVRRHSITESSQDRNFPGQLTLSDDGARMQSSGNIPRIPSRIRDSVLSVDGRTDDFLATTRPSSPLVQEATTPRHRRFSMLRSRHASDSQLFKTAQSASVAPPVPSGKHGPMAAPAIIMTAPATDNFDSSQKRKSTFFFSQRRRSPNKSFTQLGKEPRKSFGDPISGPGCHTADFNAGHQSLHQSRVTFDEPERLRSTIAPPAYGDESNSALALPLSRLSESSRSDESSADHGVFATTTTTHTISTTTTIFRLPRRKKNKRPLFPLPDKLLLPTSSRDSINTPRASTSGRPSESPKRKSPTRIPPVTAIHRPTSAISPEDDFPSPFSTSNTTFAASSLSFAAPGSTLLRADSRASARSTRSQSASPLLIHLGNRGRSSTMGSLGRVEVEEPLPTPPLPQSGRTSTSTTGRSSLGGLFNLSRLRQTSEPLFSRTGSGHIGTPGTPRSAGSKQNSISLSREIPLIIPERQEGDTPAKYLARLEEAVSRRVVATLLSKSDDEFSKNVLRSYMRGFKFFEDPLDMATRKLLMEIELPKETQQIDRVLQSFADRYHECNPGIFASSDEAYFIAFSILILHTDVFNKNNKNKMQKSDYTKNARGQGVADEILECFYDNISYTPFIHVEDDVDINGERIVAQNSRKLAFKGTGAESLRRNKEPVDPYSLILDNRLDVLRPALKEITNLDDSFSYLGTATSFNLTDLQRTFFKSGVIQIVSARSRPEAFMTQATTTNPYEARAGVVDIKVTKVGILWRKESKKKKTRSPWQDWGAILTGSQLYFFRNTSWVKSLMHQFDTHQKYGPSGTPVTFRPPLEQFKPDFLLSTDDVVALLDVNYKKHKHAFVFSHRGGFEETFLADNESDMNDWLAKLNFAAAFRTAGVRMRGVVGGSSEAQKSRGLSESESSNSSKPIQNSAGEAPVQIGRNGYDLAQQISMARRQIMTQKIAEANERLSVAGTQLELQLRNARHLHTMAPIQNKTREQVIDAAGRMAANIRGARLDIWRMRCHKEILAIDLEEELNANSSFDRQLRNHRSSTVTSQDTIIQTPKNDGLNRLTSRASTAATPQTSPRASRPNTQPSGAKMFSMNDIFQSPSRLRSQHRPQSSWELPQMAFDQTVSPTNQKFAASDGIERGIPSRIESLTVDPEHASGQHALEGMTTTPPVPITSSDEDEHKVLKEAGLFSPDSTTSESRALEAASDDEKLKLTDADVDNRPKVRHSLQRKLREAHVPTHHRSKKGKDSSSGAGIADDGASVTEIEGLARGTGSFTVHGKKASVVNFGSEWQNISPEERLHLRKLIQSDDSKLSVPSAVDDDGASVRSMLGGRPASAMSGSTTTGKSLPHPWATETSGTAAEESFIDQESQESKAKAKAKAKAA